MLEQIRMIRMNGMKVYYNLFRPSSTHSNFRRNVGVGGIFLLSVPVATFCLGTWQVKRRKWKLNLIENVKAKNKADPVILPDNFEDLSNMEYERIQIRGTFDHTKELFIGPRQLVSEKDHNAGLMSTRSQTGSQVITPFYITDKDITILVNRGWVPKNQVDPAKRLQGQVAGEIDLIGTVRLPEKRPQFCPKTKENSRQFLFRDVTKMAQMTGAAPIFIDADASSTVPGGPIGGQTRITFRNEHLSYIITWYSLCIATSYMWYRKYLRTLKPL